VLDGLERKLVAEVADAVTGRAHLDVVQSAGAGDAPTAGRTMARLGIEQITPARGFDRDVIEVSGPASAPVSRRVLPVEFVATARFSARPAAAGAAERAAARTLLLGDVSAVGHALADGSFDSGAAFAVAGDPGFAVRSFLLAAGDLDPDAVAGEDPALLRAEVRWEGRAIVWPTTPPGPEGVVAAVDVVLNAVPAALTARDPVVARGGTTTVTIGGIAGRRLTAVDPAARDALTLAVSVTSDLPPADRGRIEGGAAGTEAGVRIVAIADLATTVTYRAPTAALGTVGAELVTVHYATRDGARGVFVDALPIRLVET
jgi:hypothetical protein